MGEDIIRYMLLTENKSALVYGTGWYCRSKIGYISERYKIVGFVDRSRIFFCGYETILPEEITRESYDEILILSGSFIDIIKNLVKIGVPTEKIVPGICLKPYLVNELELMNDKVKIVVTKEGALDYYYEEKLLRTINNADDLERICNTLCDEKNLTCVKNMTVKPVSKLFGLSRGGSIVRYYIDSFINEYRKYIQGKVLEIGDDRYSHSKTHSVQTDILLFSDDKEVNEETSGVIYGDLRNGKGIKDDYYDCIIMTQVLNFMSDIKNIAEVIRKKLRIGGVCLITVSGITPISRYDMDRWGHYWNFTTKGLNELLDNTDLDIAICEYGNVKAACAFLQGMSVQDLSADDLSYNDEDFPIVISAYVKRLK